MKYLMILTFASVLTTPAYAAISHGPPPGDGAAAVFITKDLQGDGRRCEIKGIVFHTKGNPHANEVPHRVSIELRKPRGSYLECPASVTMNLESRGEAMALYELVKAAKKVVCQSSSTISGAHVNMICDGAFEIRSE